MTGSRSVGNVTRKPVLTWYPATQSRLKKLLCIVQMQFRYTSKPWDTYTSWIWTLNLLRLICHRYWCYIKSKENQLHCQLTWKLCSFFPLLLDLFFLYIIVIHTVYVLLDIRSMSKRPQVLLWSVQGDWPDSASQACTCKCPQWSHVGNQSSSRSSVFISPSAFSFLSPSNCPRGSMLESFAWIPLVLTNVGREGEERSEACEYPCRPQLPPGRKKCSNLVFLNRKTQEWRMLRNFIFWSRLAALLQMHCLLSGTQQAVMC